MKYLLIVIAAVYFHFTANAVDAYDFYGASIYDKEVPSSYMKYGINGFKPTITEVTYDSPSEKAGFKQGDIFLKINAMNAKKTSELEKITTKTITVNLFRGIERITLTIDRMAIEMERAKRIAKDKKASEDIIKTANYVSRPINSPEPSDNSEPLKFDDDALERKFGKSTPTELARQKQSTEIRRINEEKKEAIERTNLENKKHEWDVVSYKHYPKAVRVIIGTGGHLQCETYAPAPYFYEYCTINFKNGVESRLDCYGSLKDLLEVPEQLRQGLRDGLRNSYCTYRAIGATRYGRQPNGLQSSCE